MLGVTIWVDEDAVFDPHRKRRDVTGGNNYFNALIQRSEQGGLKAAAAGSRQADPMAVHVGTTKQIIHCSHAVPYLPPRQIRTGKISEVPHYSVLGAYEVITAFLCLCVPELASLALPNGVPTNDEIAALHESLTKVLIVNFSIFRMSGGYQDRGMDLIAILGNIHESGHIETA